MAWLTPPIFKPGDADADITANILGGGNSSRLFKKLVYDKQIAQEVTASQESLILGSKFNIEVDRAPRTHRRGARGGNQRGAGRTLRGKRTRTPKSWSARTTRIEDPASSRAGDARRLRRQGRSTEQLRALPGDTRIISRQDIQRYREASRAGASRPLLTQYLQPNARGRLFAVPGEKKLAPETAGAADARRVPGRRAERQRRRTVAAGPAEARPVKAAQLPTPERFKLPNGLTVILSEHRRAAGGDRQRSCCGAGATPTRLTSPGLANFTAAMLDEGTATRKALRHCRRSGAVRRDARLTGVGDGLNLSVSVTSLAKKFPAALELMADVAVHPTFPAGGSRAPAGEPPRQLVAVKSNPAQVVSRVMASRRCTARVTRTATSSSAPRRRIRLSRRDAMVEFWQAAPGSWQCRLSSLSARSPARELEPLATKAFSGWAGQAAVALADAGATRHERESHHRRHAGGRADAGPSGQSWASRARRRISKPVELMNTILGRLVHQPDQSQPAGGQRLYLRRVLDVCGAPRDWPLLHVCCHSHRRDGSGRDRDVQRNQENQRCAGHS